KAGAPAANPTIVAAPVAASAADTPSAEATKRCPFCGEVILAIAKKCKHCGEFLDRAPPNPFSAASTGSPAASPGASATSASPAAAGAAAPGAPADDVPVFTLSVSQW